MGTYKIECNIGAACPICGSDLEHSDDERDGRNVTETYQCENCRVYVSYHWTMPKVSYAEVEGREQRTAKELDRAEQEERWARDEGTITFEPMMGHGWKRTED